MSIRRTNNALAELKGKGMQVNDVSPAELGCMREKLTRVHATVAASVGMDLWTQTQAQLGKMRGK